MVDLAWEGNPPSKRTPALPHADISSIEAATSRTGKKKIVWTETEKQKAKKLEKNLEEKGNYV